MSIFRRRKKSADPHQVIGHLMKATIMEAAIGTEEALDRAISHLVADLNVLDHETLVKVSSLLILEGSRQSAAALKAGVMDTIRGLLDGEGPEEAQEPADGPEKPTDLQEDQGLTLGAQTGAEWAEDRR